MVPADDKKSIASHAIVLRGDDVNTEALLIKRDDIRMWTVPGGMPELGESEAEAAVRETKEETGYDTVITRRVGRYSLKGLRAIGRANVFVARVVGGSIRRSPESRDVRWFGVGRLPYTLLPFHRQRIRDAILGKENILVQQPYPMYKLLFYYLITPWLLPRLVRFYFQKE